MKRYFALLTMTVFLIVASTAMAMAPENYNITLNAYKDLAGKLYIEVHNGNNFVVNDIVLSVLDNGIESKEQIGSIAADSSWTTGEITQDYAEFNAVGYFQGQEHIIDESLFDATTGVYSGEIHHAMVWPDDDLDDAWAKEVVQEFPDIGVTLTVSFIARGPRIAYSGHSFTGLWDSSYYYFRELAKMGGWNAQVAYSYWGGTGLAHHAGLVEGTEAKSEQTDKVLAANEYYDFYSVAGNSDEGVSTTSGIIGATDYNQRDNMIKGAEIAWNRANSKGAQLILWSTRGYKYGYFQDMKVKPWEKGEVGQVFEKDGNEYTITLTSKDMAAKNANWYTEMANTVGDGSAWVAQVGTAYNYINENYEGIVNPYLEIGQESGDYGHQNNQGNYLAACVYYSLIFGESPEGLGVPESHTWGMDGGCVTQEQAKIMQEVAWKVVSGEYSLVQE